MTRIAAIVAALLVLAGLAGTYLLTQRTGKNQTFANCARGATGGDLGGPFALMNSEGQMVTDAELLAKPALLYFGYTFCPDVCPFDMARNAQAASLLSERGLDVTPVFITIDPERDTPEVVGDFAYYMGENVVGLTGTPEQIDAAISAYKVYRQFQKPEEDDSFYLVNHSSITYLTLPGYGFVDFFRRDVTPEDMAERTACFMEAAAG